MTVDQCTPLYGYTYKSSFNPVCFLVVQQGNSYDEFPYSSFDKAIARGKAIAQRLPEADIHVCSRGPIIQIS